MALSDGLVGFFSFKLHGHSLRLVYFLALLVVHWVRSQRLPSVIITLIIIARAPRGAM
jgi:hypothetical protein